MRLTAVIWVLLGMTARADENASTNVNVVPRLVVLGVAAGGWRTVQDADGSLWQEHEESTPSVKWMSGGAALLIGTWLAAGISTSTSSRDLPGMGFLPVLGSFFAAAAEGTHDCYGSGGCPSHAAIGLWVADGFVQAAGLAMLLAGISAGPKKLERRPIFVGPMGVSGRF
jgi:hypothetical protein